MKAQCCAVVIKRGRDGHLLKGMTIDYLVRVLDLAVGLAYASRFFDQ